VVLDTLHYWCIVRDNCHKRTATLHRTIKRSATILSASRRFYIFYSNLTGEYVEGDIYILVWGIPYIHDTQHAGMPIM